MFNEKTRVLQYGPRLRKYITVSDRREDHWITL